jgi:F-type H+-transporting ATPase subunit delta
MELLGDLLGASRDLRLFFQSPVITIEKKRAVVNELFAKKLQKLTLDFLSMLVVKRREETLHDIVKQFMALRDEDLGIISVEIRTVVPCTGGQEKSLVKKIEEYSGKKVRATYSLDKAIQGGFIARAGDTVIDGSIRRQFELLRERFVMGAYERN